MYEYRNVKCGYCGHEFTWLKEGWLSYSRKDGKRGLATKCPQCAERVIIFDKELTAFPVELISDKIELDCCETRCFI